MNKPTSQWFAEDLDQHDRKALVCLLFEVRRQIPNDHRLPLFNAYLRRLDAEYHALKAGDSEPPQTVWERLR